MKEKYALWRDLDVRDTIAVKERMLDIVQRNPTNSFPRISHRESSSPFWVRIHVEGNVCKMFKRVITFFMFNVVAYLLFMAAIQSE
jgi:hypothetical protein